MVAALVVASAACSSEPGTSGTTLPSGGPTTATSGTPPTSAPGTTVTEPTATTAPSTTLPGVEVVAASLAGLPFEEFVDTSFDALLLRSPQMVTELGLAARYGLRNDRLDDRSDAFVRETMALQATILDLLRTYDRAALDSDQQVAYDVYEWMLDDLVRGHRFAYHDYPLNSFIYSYHVVTVDFFTDIFPLETAADAEDYVACVAQIRRQADQVLEGLRIREQLGVYPPDFDIARTRRAMADQLGPGAADPFGIDPTTLAIYTSFEERTQGLSGLAAADRQALLDELATRLEESFVPAWVTLIDYLEGLEEIATSDAGVWKLPDGDEYYAYLLRSETTTGLSAEEIHQIGLAEVERVRAEMQAIFTDLGYPPTFRLQDSIGRVISGGGWYDTSQGGADAVVEAYGAIIDEVSARIDPLFGLQPVGRVEVIGEALFPGAGAYYVPGSLDGSRAGAFHIGVGAGIVPRYTMASTAYHEAIPGHHFQMTLAQELDLSLMQNTASFNGYLEGWALYAERLAAELGLYQDDPFGNVGRLQLELLRAVRLVADTGIHAMGWSRQEARVYVSKAMGEPAGRSDAEVNRYIAAPGQATSYLVGMLEIVELRRRAEEALGEAFDLAAFHDVVLGHGAVPLEILEGLVDDWIEAVRAG